MKIWIKMRIRAIVCVTGNTIARIGQISILYKMRTFRTSVAVLDLQNVAPGLKAG